MMNIFGRCSAEDNGHEPNTMVLMLGTLKKNMETDGLLQLFLIKIIFIPPVKIHWSKSTFVACALFSTHQRNHTTVTKHE